MSKADEYLGAVELCLFKASEAEVEEIRQVWITIAESYRYLAMLESEYPEGGNTASAEDNSSV